MPAIEIEGLGKRYRLGERLPYRVLRSHVARFASKLNPWRPTRPRPGPAATHVWALRGISARIEAGEVVGVIGRNGAGKTTLLRILAQITEPTEGRCLLRGTVSSLLEVGTGFHPELTGRENIYMNGAILGMSRAHIDREYDAIVEFSGVPEFIDTPIKRYSTGMAMRLAFAVAAHLESDVMLVDEVLAVGDTEFQRKSMGRIQDIGSQGRTVLFVSHSMPSILRLCPRVILLDHGGLIVDGPAHDVVRTYLESGLGTTAARVWGTPEDAPGDDNIRLRSVRVLDDNDESSEEIDIRSDVRIELEYWVKSVTGVGPGAIIRVQNTDGVMLFASSNLANVKTSDFRLEEGLVRTTCRIPGNFLAEDQHIVTVLLVSRQPGRFHGGEEDAVAFHVVDRSKGDGARGYFTQDWPGAVRPKLDWTTEQLPPQPVP